MLTISISRFSYKILYDFQQKHIHHILSTFRFSDSFFVQSSYSKYSKVYTTRSLVIPPFVLEPIGSGSDLSDAEIIMRSS